jgi:hypothetical protein
MFDEFAWCEPAGTMGILNEFTHSGILNKDPHLVAFFAVGLGELHINNKNLAILLLPVDRQNDWLSSDQPSRLKTDEDLRRAAVVNSHLRRCV